MATSITNDNASRSPRLGTRHRQTKESDVQISICLDGSGESEITTGLPFFDHMLDQLARHGGMDIVAKVKGDLEVDAHHTVEDTGIALGEAFFEALGDKRGVRRFGSVAVPLDETLVDVALDLSSRAYCHYAIVFEPDTTPLGSPGFDPQLAEEFWRAFSSSAQITLHISLRYGKSIHHILEASFKAVARALRDAVHVESDVLPSTKGVL